MRILTILIVLALTACNPLTKADLLVYNGHIQTVDERMNEVEALVIHDGKILDAGTKRDMQSKYLPMVKKDLKGAHVYPGLIDAHCHFIGLAENHAQVNLIGTNSYEDVVQRVEKFVQAAETKPEFIIGRGWDQNDWELQEFPTNTIFNELFPNTPVALTRVDGHAMIVNQAALTRAGITPETEIAGGEIQRDEDGTLTGILIDNPMMLVEAQFPALDEPRKRELLGWAQEYCLAYGLTTLSDAGLNREQIELLDAMHEDGSLSLRVYAMISNKPELVDHYLNAGTYKTDRLNVTSFKVYADGALGSRGAAMREDYSDQDNHRGAMLSTPAQLRELATRLAQSEFQMNTHAIGDSANVEMLRIYQDVLQGMQDKRWRIEHAQVMPSDGYAAYGDNIVPSVQPTHATSDMYWAMDRLGEERIEHAYAYQTILKNAGKIALGTDFPVEQVNPWLTFYAAVGRQDTSGYPAGGFQMDQALTREQALRGMTIWAAYANKEDHEKGSLEVGKFADFIVINEDLMSVPLNKIPDLQVLETWIDGVQVYEAEPTAE